MAVRRAQRGLLRSRGRRWASVKGAMEPFGPFVPHETRSTDEWGIPGDAEVERSKFDTRLWRAHSEEWRAGEEDDLWELLFPVDAGQMRKLVHVRPYWMNSYARWVHKTHAYAMQPRYDDRLLAPDHPGLSADDKDIVDMLRHTWKGSKALDADEQSMIRDRLLDKILNVKIGDVSKGADFSKDDYYLHMLYWYREDPQGLIDRIREEAERESVFKEIAVMNRLAKFSKEAANIRDLMDPFRDLPPKLAYLAKEELQDKVLADKMVSQKCGPEIYQLYSRSPERWPPERLARMYGLTLQDTKETICRQAELAAYEQGIEPDRNLRNRLFMHENLAMNRALGSLVPADNLKPKTAFMGDKALFKVYLKKREAAYTHINEMDDPYRFLETEEDRKDFWGDNYEYFNEAYPDLNDMSKHLQPVYQIDGDRSWLSEAYTKSTKSDTNWVFAEMSNNVGSKYWTHDLRPENPKRRRFVVRQPDGSMRTAKKSEIDHWYDFEDHTYARPDFTYSYRQPQDKSERPYLPKASQAPWGKHSKNYAGQFRQVDGFFQSHFTRTGKYSVMPHHSERGLSGALPTGPV
eukprot:TRINITY_DN16275_c0_g1_i1.p1 TRINITY_DN16275_c0_g1~~TRINITY_DN16275_c0_g1_i1.p1  ORF type:complete len:587 (+),score=127.89 TRINITY_DN16275_c0_g1_i1:33-1763(+)